MTGAHRRANAGQLAFHACRIPAAAVKGEYIQRIGFCQAQKQRAHIGEREITLWDTTRGLFPHPPWCSADGCDQMIVPCRFAFHLLKFGRRREHCNQSHPLRPVGALARVRFVGKCSARRLHFRRADYSPQWEASSPGYD